MTPEEKAKAEAYLSERKRDYQTTFGTPHGQRVLQDLTAFCRGAETCAVPGDEHRTFMLLGRNEVFLRIHQHMNLVPEQLFRLYVRQPIGSTDE